MTLTQNPAFWAILALLVFRFALDFVADLLNLSHFAPEPPTPLRETIDLRAYAKSIAYQRDSMRFDLFARAIAFALFLGFWLWGGFQWADQIARSLGFGPIGTGLVFFGLLSVLKGISSLPFRIYDTFVIEQRHGFNRMTARTFVGDLLKSTVLGAILGGVILGGVIWFFENAGSLAWVYAWGAFTVFQLLLVFLAPVLILPLFNKFEPLAAGPLKEQIEAYARAQGFVLSGIFTMDGSKRSSKSNAFFTGFGKFRRLVLFDTLIAQQTPEELTAVVAHEVGHFRCGHIPRTIALSIAVTAAMFLALSQFLGQPALFSAFKVEEPSVYAGLALFSIALGPLMRIFGIFTQALSRKHEFEADAFAVRTYGHASQLASALKKLSRENKSHLSPHWLKVILDYTHPPIVKRLERLGGA